MKLRKYEARDSNIICSWIKDEKALYQWSANRIGKFPLKGYELNEAYSKAGEIVPFVAVDDDNENTIMGNILIRYPNEEDRKTVRFCFVIVSPSLRGQGYGKKMVQLAIEYARKKLQVSRITLGVFLNNPKARHCYESIGFKPCGEISMFKKNGIAWECTEMEITF